MFPSLLLSVDEIRSLQGLFEEIWCSQGIHDFTKAKIMKISDTSYVHVYLKRSKLRPVF